MIYIETTYSLLMTLSGIIAFCYCPHRFYRYISIVDVIWQRQVETSDPEKLSWKHSTVPIFLAF